ncbi:MAG: hypothetical protein QOH61_839 [Chloroflexota bacterium]|nr:hypothetical protein [Chloroflexota bacterium]
MSRSRGFAVLLVLIAVACGDPVQPTASPGSSPTSGPLSSPSSQPSAVPTVPPSPSPSPVPSPSGSPGIGHASGPSDLILRVTIAGGFINPVAQLFALPEIAIYGDGTVLAPDTSGEVVPPPAVPLVVATSLSEAGLQRVLAAAGVAGLLGKNAHYEGGPMAEASTTTFTVVAEGHTHTVSAYALSRPGGDTATMTAMKALGQFEADLMDIATLAGADGVTVAPHAYQPTALEVFVAPAENSGQEPSPAPLAWPLATALSSFGQPVGSDSGGSVRGPSLTCGIVTGADLATLEPLLANAASDSLWTSDGSLWTLTLRPELPDETSCPGV